MVAPIAAAIIFVAMFVLIVADKIERHIVTLGCGFLTLVGVFLIIRGFDLAAVWETLSLESFTQLHFWWADPNVTHEGGHGGIDWATILFYAIQPVCN